MERKQKDIASILAMMENLHVETYGSLNLKEKFIFIIYQMRLNL